MMSEEDSGYIRQEGVFGIGVQKGGTANFQKASFVYTEKSSIAEEVRQVTDFLSKKYPKSSLLERQVLLKSELQSLVQQKASFGERLGSALEAGSAELIKVLTQNTFVSVSIELVRGWLQA